MKVTKELQYYAHVILGLHKNFKPHEGQIKIGKALINDGIRDIFVEAGRNFGKTRLMSYLLWRWAMFNPGSENYYFAPYMKQAREIIWRTRMIQECGPGEWVKGEPNDTEMRLTFHNNSFIKCDGSDNVHAYRGVKPRGLIILDEFKDFRPEFFEAFDPNRAAHNAPMIIIGTPPDRHCQFSEIREIYKKHTDKRYFHGPTSDNPHISREWLAAKKKELEDRGELDVWQREYEAIEVYGGSQKIFPMISPKCVLPHEELVRRVDRDKKRMDWILFCDPAAASVFGTLYACHNPYTSEVFILDEIYEEDQARMTVRVQGSEILKRRNDIQDRYDWRQGYDEAETWFMNEMMSNYNEHFEPSMKATNDKEAGLTLIKDMLLLGKLIISDKCKKLYWELDNYYKDKNGQIPKKGDHLIDCLRYILAALYYKIPSDQEQLDPFDKASRKPRFMVSDERY